MLRYANISENDGGPEAQVLAAFARISDGTSEQAAAIADIIDALGRLTATARKGGETE